MFLILEIHQPDLEEIIGYVWRKEIRHPISKTNIMKNWGITRAEKETERRTIYNSRPVDDHLIEEMIQNLPFDEIK